MASFQWTPEYTVGVAALDAEHRKLVQIVCVMQQATHLGRGKEVSQAVLAELRRYFSAHFAHEERLMARHLYPDFERHAGLHRDWTARVLACRRAGEDGPVDAGDLLQYALGWLRDHILAADKMYAAFFAGKGAARPV